MKTLLILAARLWIKAAKLTRIKALEGQIAAIEGALADLRAQAKKEDIEFMRKILDDLTDEQVEELLAEAQKIVAKHTQGDPK